MFFVKSAISNISSMNEGISFSLSLIDAFMMLETWEMMFFIFAFLSAAEFGRLFLIVDKFAGISILLFNRVGNNVAQISVPHRFFLRMSQMKHISGVFSFFSRDEKIFP